MKPPQSDSNWLVRRAVRRSVDDKSSVRIDIMGRTAISICRADSISHEMTKHEYSYCAVLLCTAIIRRMY